MSNQKKYRTAEGDHLIIDEGYDGRYRIWWYIASDGETGACVGEDEPGATPPKGESDGDWDCWTAARAAKSFADGHTSTGYYFESMSQAKKALRAANEMLLAGGKPWPDWAIQAQAAGWTPPKNWKP